MTVIKREQPLVLTGKAAADFLAYKRKNEQRAKARHDEYVKKYPRSSSETTIVTDES
ncbi:hypothetical protein [Candidatus Enterococcus huntleyi]|uniref:hypothetical protein n=1 Tax=Candidatus Enterococcus huntleyi TaxID=1857217 RepID=UPI00137AC474|nr:hypothetical protein [Enterococcus sp. JM4C]